MTSRLIAITIKRARFLSLQMLMANGQWLIAQKNIYSYLPALRRATSSAVRNRQAPRFKFFLVRPA